MMHHSIGEYAVIMAGKFNPIDFDANDPFCGGWGIHRFMNMLLAAPPSGLIPPVFMGVVTNFKTDRLNWMIMVFDPNDRTNDYFPGDLFADGVNFSIAPTHISRLVGRTTTYGITANYSTAERVDYSSLPPGMETSNKSGA